MFSGNNNNISRNANRVPNTQKPQRTQMEQENQMSLLFIPIQKESCSNGLKQKTIEFQLLIKQFCQKIISLNCEAQMKQLNQLISTIENVIQKDSSIDWDQLTRFLEALKDQYLKKFGNLQYHLKTIAEIGNIPPGDPIIFLRKISSFEISFPECQSLLYLEQEINNLEFFLHVLTPQVNQYKEILYYEKTNDKNTKYSKNQIQAPYSMSKDDLNTLIGLLNQYYKFKAMPKKQERYVSFVNQTTLELNQNNLQSFKEFILILEIPLEVNSFTYAILFSQEQQNQRIFKSKSIGKMRSQLQSLSQKLGCTTFTPTLVSEFNLQTAIQELLKIVAPQIEMKNLIQFLQEIDYLVRDDKNESNGQYGNYCVDVFEMEKLGFQLV